MDIVDVLRSIRHDLLEYIQEKVLVDFDNVSKVPVSFTHRGNRCIIREILGFFRTQSKRHINGYLVRDDGGETYFLYFHFLNSNPECPFNAGCWVLSFRVLNDGELMVLYREDRRMLLNTTLKRVVDFHGHLCPDLVIGCKACEYAQKILYENGEPEGGISVIAENCTSALDAVQILVGTTVGNQRLRVFDFGKHNYIFSLKNGQNGIRLSLKKLYYGDENEHQMLEEKIMKDQSSLDEVVHFQGLLDGRIKRLLASPAEDLFFVEPVRPMRSTNEMPTTYHCCSECGQQVLKSRAIEFQGKIYCIPCFQGLDGCGPEQGLH